LGAIAVAVVDDPLRALAYVRASGSSSGTGSAPYNIACRASGEIGIPSCRSVASTDVSGPVWAGGATGGSLDDFVTGTIQAEFAF